MGNPFSLGRYDSIKANTHAWMGSSTQAAVDLVVLVLVVAVTVG